MNERGDKVMGFDHLKTTHHFLLKTDGGVIKVEANDANGLKAIYDFLRFQIKEHMTGDSLEVDSAS